MPRYFQDSGTVICPIRDGWQSILVSQVVSERSCQSIQPAIARQPWLLSQHGCPGLQSFASKEAIVKLGENKIVWFSEIDP